MDRTSAAEPAHVPYPVSRVYYLVYFRPGEALSDWPHTRDALELYRRLWTELKRLGQSPDWWQEKILTQDSGHANWQHGQLYVTPSKATAVRYAGSGAAHGGELLQSCRDALDELAKLDPGRTTELLCGAGRIGCFLKETGRPILIEFRNVQVSGLSSERQSEDVSAQLAALANMGQPQRGFMEQQINFRLAPGCAIVGRVFELSIDDIGSPVSSFQLREIVDSDMWTGA